MCGTFEPCTVHATAVACAEWWPRILQAFEKASGKKVAVKLVDRRPGDAEAVWAATNTAQQVRISSEAAHSSCIGDIEYNGSLTDCACMLDDFQCPPCAQQT